MPRWTMTLEERFWSKVTPAEWDECWEWAASLNSAGYGQMYVDGMPRRAHRIAYELLRAEIPEGLVIDHLCRNRSCVNPWHLEPVTNEVNIARGEWHAERAPSPTCAKGHAYTEENTHIAPDGTRRCRACARATRMASYYRLKGGAA